MPEVISTRLLEQVKARLAFNRTNNRTDIKEYYLTGFLRCGVCGRALTGRRAHNVRKVYDHPNDEKQCPLRTAHGKELEAAVLGHLYGAFLDQPAFDAAVKRALPSAKDRKALGNEMVDTEKRLAENQRKIDRLVDAVANGVDKGLLLDKQDRLKAEQESLTKRIAELVSQLATMPDVDEVQRAAMLTRLRLVMEYKGGRDWRKLPFDEIRRFLLHLFGETTVNSKTGIFVAKDAKGVLSVTFKGRVDFHAFLVNGRPITEEMQIATDRMNAEILGEFRTKVKEADQRRDAGLEALLKAGKPSRAYNTAT